MLRLPPGAMRDGPSKEVMQSEGAKLRGDEGMNCVRESGHNLDFTSGMVLLVKIGMEGGLLEDLEGKGPMGARSAA